MAGVDGQRSHNRVERSLKKIFQTPFLFSTHFFRTHEMNALGGQLQQNRIQKTEMLFFG